MLLLSNRDIEMLERIAGIVSELYSRKLTHDYTHALRVMGLAFKIADEMEEEIDGLILGTASLLHDIGRAAERDHERISAKMADDILRELGYPAEKIEKVKKAIISHSFSSGIKPGTLEAMILSDADKLDAMGAVGVARVFCYSCVKERGWEDTLSHFKEKILRLGDMLYTRPARRLAARRELFLSKYLEELAKDLEEARNAKRFLSGESR